MVDAESSVGGFHDEWRVYGKPNGDELFSLRQFELAPGAEVVRIEHPSGTFEAWVRLNRSREVEGAGIIRTARKLMDGLVFPRS